jgi:hypothetical protein
MLQIEVLTATRNSLMLVVAGLEDAIRLKGIDLNARQLDSQRSLLDSPPVITAVIGIMRTEKTPMGAREIHLALRSRGLIINYSTLYKALNRETVKKGSLIRRRHGRYELAELASTAAGTER